MDTTCSSSARNWMAADEIWPYKATSGVAASKSARNNPPTTENAEDEKSDLDKSSEINFEQKCKYLYIYFEGLDGAWHL